MGCMASMPQKVARSAGNVTDRPGDAGRRRPWLLRTRSGRPRCSVSRSTWTGMGVSSQDASATATTSTSGWSEKAWRSPIGSIPLNTCLRKFVPAKRKRACGEQTSICLKTGVRDRGSRMLPSRHRRCCSSLSSNPTPAARDGPARRLEAARKRGGIWRTAPGAVVLTATMTAFLARACADACLVRTNVLILHTRWRTLEIS